MKRVVGLAPGPQAAQEVSQLWLQVVSASMALMDGNLALIVQDLQKAEERRDAALQAARSARRERDDLRRAYCQDSPLQC
ncbi:hypothetical protein LIER_16751 [Lithospermum erythrorhizon]|uniref:Uncharacterized protein n=1 Tax=Lithospermum erythrorhizon TaxID=34254 RepID=A0AAV3QAC5_LITER